MSHGIIAKVRDYKIQVRSKFSRSIKSTLGEMPLSKEWTVLFLCLWVPLRIFWHQISHESRYAAAERNQTEQISRTWQMEDKQVTYVIVLSNNKKKMFRRKQLVFFVYKITSKSLVLPMSNTLKKNFSLDSLTWRVINNIKIPRIFFAQFVEFKFHEV